MYKELEKRVIAFTNELKRDFQETYMEWRKEKTKDEEKRRKKEVEEGGEEEEEKEKEEKEKKRGKNSNI